jgi:hypothetical protein
MVVKNQLTCYCYLQILSGLQVMCYTVPYYAVLYYLEPVRYERETPYKLFILWLPYRVIKAASILSPITIGCSNTNQNE